MTLTSRPTSHAWWAVPTAAALILTGCSGDSESDTGPSSPSTPAPSQSSTAPSPTSQTDANIDVDSDGDPSADAQDADGDASLGTAVATISVPLPGEWQYEGTYGEGTPPYAVLVDASEPFDLSEPGSDAYRESVWVRVETYQVGGESPWGDEVPENADEFADQIAERTDGESRVAETADRPLIHARYAAENLTDESQVDDLLVRDGDIWILARPFNVDVDAYLDGETQDSILHAVLDDSEIK